MSTFIDGTEILWWTLNDVILENAYLDGVLIYTRVEGPGEGEYILDSRPGPSDFMGYSAGVYGDLDPNTWKSNVITVMNESSAGTFRVSIDGPAELPLNEFDYVTIIDLGKTLYTVDATKSLLAEGTTWEWPTAGINLFEDFYDVQINGEIIEIPIDEVTVEFDFIPDASTTNGTVVGFTSDKYDKREPPFGDLNPQVFKSASVGAILELTADGRFLFGFEDAHLQPDYWRSFQIPEIGYEVLAANADGFHDDDSDQGTFWSFNNPMPALEVGRNYKVVLKGPKEELIESIFNCYFEQQGVNNPEGGQDIITGVFYYPGQVYWPESLGSINPEYFKGHRWHGIYQIVTDYAQSQERRDQYVMIGEENLPQGYWHTISIPDESAWRSIDMVFNEHDDDDEILYNTWSYRETNDEWLPINVNVDVSILHDTWSIPAVRRNLYILEGTAKEDVNVDGGWSIELDSAGYRTTEINRIVMNEKNGMFGIFIEGQNRLWSYLREIRIPELGWVIYTENMIFDRKTFKGELLWYAYVDLPVLKPGQKYTLRLYG